MNLLTVSNNGPNDTKFIREKISLSDVKKYVRDNRIFTEDEMFWVEFFWRIGIEMVGILLTEELLEKHFGYSGKKAMNDFVQRKLRASVYEFQKNIDYTKVNRDNVLVREYLAANPGVKTLVFYLLSSTCYTLCLIQVNTKESQLAHTYMVKMNHVAIKMINSVFISTIEDLERINISANNNFALLSEQKDIIVNDTYVDNSCILLSKNNLYDELYKKHALLRKQCVKLTNENILLKYELESKTDICDIDLNAPIDYINKKSKFKSESNMITALSNIFPNEEAATNWRPNWLKNPETNKNLEIDAYYSKLKLAFEYDGIQHRLFTRMFHNTPSDFFSQVGRDAIKAVALKHLGIKLIRISDMYKTVEEIEEYLRRILREIKVIQ